MCVIGSVKKWNPRQKKQKSKIWDLANSLLFQIMKYSLALKRISSCDGLLHGRLGFLLTSQLFPRLTIPDWDDGVNVDWLVKEYDELLRYYFAISVPTQVTRYSDRLDRCPTQTNSRIYSRSDKWFAFFTKIHPKFIRHTNFVSSTDSSG